MTVTLHVRFDGRVLVPEGPVDLPIGPTLEIQVTDTLAPAAALRERQADELLNLADLANVPPLDPQLRGDAAVQLDRYFLGAQKNR
jgi:hypothetical protein